MGKEVKIGLAVIAVLLSVFATVLYTRLRGGDTTMAAAAKESTAKEKDDKRKDKKKNHKKLSSGPSPAKVAAKHRSDRFSSSTNRRPVEPEATAGESRYLDVGREDDDGGDGQEDRTDSTFSPSKNRYENRDRTRYGSVDEPPTDDADDSAGVATLDDGTATDDDDESTTDAGGKNSVLGDADETLEGDPEFKWQDRATGGAGRNDRGQSARLSDADELESTEPPSELGPADVEAPLSPDEVDESAVEPVGGNRLSRGRRDGNEERPFSTASRRGTAPIESEDDGNLSDEADVLDVEGETYTVRPNDNYWIISQRVYGTGSYFKALQEFNRDRYPNPSRLDVGDEVSVPDVAELEQTYPKLCPKRRHVAAQRRTATLASSRSGEGTGERMYTVAEGDTLFDIARRELGSAERWAEIHDLNQDQLGDDIHYLTPGTRLTLPGDNLPGDKPGDKPRERITTRTRRGASRR